jgi:hypothetical protein
VGANWSPRPRKPPANRAEVAQRVLQARTPLLATGVANPVQGDWAMPSRTKRHAAGENPPGKTPRSPAARQRRRQEALERSLAGAPLAVICRERGGSKRWLSTWKKRLNAPSRMGCRNPLGVHRACRRKPRSASQRTSSGCRSPSRQRAGVRSALTSGASISVNTALSGFPRVGRSLACGAVRHRRATPTLFDHTSQVVLLLAAVGPCEPAVIGSGLAHAARH